MQPCDQAIYLLTKITYFCIIVSLVDKACIFIFPSPINGSELDSGMFSAIANCST